VLLSGDGQSVLVPYFDNLANEIVLHKSDDVGDTFTSWTVAAPEGVTLDDASYKHFADSTLTTLLFPSGAQSLLSTDGGETFSVVAHEGYASNYAAGASDGQALMLLLYDANTPSQRINLSIDGGDTWNLIDPDPGHSRIQAITAGDISDDGQSIALIGNVAGADEGVALASADGGATWSYQAGYTDANWFLLGRVSLTSDAALAYASGFNIVYQSDDAGASWTLLTEAGGVTAISEDAAVQAYIPQNGDVEGFNVQLSTDGGATFTPGPEIAAFSLGAIAVAGSGTLAGVIAYAGDLWLSGAPVPPYEPVYCLDVTPFTAPGKTPQSGGPADAPH
jgi:hypothetical protein